MKAKEYKIKKAKGQQVNNDQYLNFLLSL